MGKPYARELDQFHFTYTWAKRQNVKRFAHFLSRWSGEHAYIVGSGGSYSAAVAAALFRELAHASSTLAVTPLEFGPALQRIPSPSLLLSAEGKNKDILAAARSAVAADSLTAALTLTTSNPLVDLANCSGAVRIFAFQMDWEKDGYLATNSLLATTLLIYRGLFGDESFEQHLRPLFDVDRLALRRHKLLTDFHLLKEVRSRGLILLYGPSVRFLAVDLESKLSESALGLVQITDFRQFAHGRHLQLSASSTLPVVLAVYSDHEALLAKQTLEHVPTPVLELRVDGSIPEAIAVASLLDAMYLTEAAAQGAAHDPGQPTVPEFGRRIYRADVENTQPIQPAARSILHIAAARKAGLRGNHRDTRSQILDAAKAYLARLEKASFKAIVCDFDGTLCRAENRFEGMSTAVVETLVGLIERGLVIAIASGRGDSLRDELLRKFPAPLHGQVRVGYYSGSLLQYLDQPFLKPHYNPDFALLLQWMERSAYGEYCKPLNDIARGGQLSIRVPSVTQSRRFRGAIQAWLNATGRHSWRVYCSGHSVDVLDAETSKIKVVNAVALALEIDPLTDILRIGDCGHEDGNDFELLRSGMSLSCESVSSDLNACWNFAPPGCNQSDATLLYLRSLERENAIFRVNMDRLLHSRRVGDFDEA